jgi:hypothetical protein
MEVLEKLLGDFFIGKMPPLPSGIKDGTAKIFPWILIILGMLGLLATFSILGMFSVTMAMTTGFAVTTGTSVLSTVNLILLCAIAPVLQLLAILAGYWMLKRQVRGWRLALLTTFAGFIMHLFSFSLSGIIINFIFIYLLFQIREYYTAI